MVISMDGMTRIQAKGAKINQYDASKVNQDIKEAFFNYIRHSIKH